jgi:hypothetical protein
MGACVKAAAETTAGIVKYLAYIGAAREELAAGRIDVLHRQDQAVDGAWLGGSDSLAEDD